MYTVSAVPTASSYTWTASGGAQITNGQGTNSVRVRFTATTTTSVTLTVRANNACGSSVIRSRTITVNPNCKVTGEPQNADEPVSAIESLLVFPNPTNGRTTISFTADRSALYALKITDILGRVVLTEQLHAMEGTNSKIINLENAVKGLYFVSLHTEDGEEKTLKLLIE